MGWVIAVFAIVGSLYLIKQSGKRLSDDLGVSSDTHSIGEGLSAAKRRQYGKSTESRTEQQWRRAGKAMGDERLGTAMKDALDDVTDECSRCGSPVWSEADKCGHCGSPLEQN